MTTSRALAFAALMTLAAGCGDTVPPTSPAEPTPFARTEVYTGTLTPQASGFYSFTAPQTATIELTLTSLVGASSGLPIDTTVTVGFGVPSGFGCATSATAPASSALGPQISRSVEAGVYCARIEDPGSLTSAAVFAVRITIRTGGTPTPAPGSTTFASQVIVGGFSARAFTASVTGTVTLRLESVSPSSVRLGLGLGVPTATGGCAVNRQILDAGPGSEISATVAAATYCVRVFDPGTLTAPVNFTVRIDYP